jgi:hypothetical protein
LLTGHQNDARLSVPVQQMPFAPDTAEAAAPVQNREIRPVHVVGLRRRNARGLAPQERRTQKQLPVLGLSVPAPTRWWRLV